MHNGKGHRDSEDDLLRGGQFGWLQITALADQRGFQSQVAEITENSLGDEDQNSEAAYDLRTKPARYRNAAAHAEAHDHYLAEDQRDGSAGQLAAKQRL